MMRRAGSAYTAASPVEGVMTPIFTGPVSAAGAVESFAVPHHTNQPIITTTITIQIMFFIFSFSKFVKFLKRAKTDIRNSELL